MTGPQVDLAPLVRPAGRDDAPELSRLAALATAHMAAERGGSVLLARDPERLVPPAVPGSDGELVAMGCLGPVTVGYLWVRLARAGDGIHAEIVALFVEPPARSVGVGRALMDSALGWAAEQGCVGIDAVALPGDRATKNFFEAAGLVTRMLTVHRPLGPSGG